MIWITILDAKVNVWQTDILTYRQPKIKFKNCFLILITEDPSVATNVNLEYKCLFYQCLDGPSRSEERFLSIKTSIKTRQLQFS